jgi:hypothetical protein
MTMRRLFQMVLTVALAVALIVLLVKVGKVDLRVTLQQLKSVRLVSFARIALLNALLIYLSTEKWRIIDAAWRRPSDSLPSRTTSYALTSVGLAMGIFLPLQFAMAAARTLGTYVHGAALKRGAAGTLLEQGFDVYMVGFLAVASGITWFYHGGAKTWALCAAAAIALALLAVGPTVWTIRRLAAKCNTSADEPHNRILRSVWALQHSGILNAALARRLVVLSALRTATVVLMSIQTAEAVGLFIPAWLMAAAIPFVSVANIIAVTPGGIGINDLAGAGALQVFGIPFAIGAQWVLANRVLVSASYLMFAICATIALGAGRMAAPGAGFKIQEDNQ